MDIVPYTSSQTASAPDLDQAVLYLRQGHLVAFPTETVYGLGADAENPSALEKLYSLKSRPYNHPVIVHIASASEMAYWAVDIPDIAYEIAEAFWPGPLTLILKKSPRVLDAVTGGQDTVGLRVPNHPVALTLLNRFKGGLAGPSANRFTQLSPTTAQAVAQQFDINPQGPLAMILDGGSCQVGIESTILDLSRVELGEPPRILRPGMVGWNALSSVVNFHKGDLHQNTPKNLPLPNTRVPGSHQKHYAPNAQTFLIEPEQLHLLLKESLGCVSSSQRQNTKASIISMSVRPKEIAPSISWFPMGNTPEMYAQQLYATLLQADLRAPQVILVESVPQTWEWEAIADRLNRATQPYSQGAFNL